MPLQKRFKKSVQPTVIAPERRLLTPKQSVLYVGLSIDAVYEMIRAREIPYIIRPGTGNRPKYLIDRLDWDRWIEKRKISAVAA
jgi:predicted DNA-binding transcriptional regulator AlpA